jgi:hypothetical protein
MDTSVQCMEDCVSKAAKPTTSPLLFDLNVTMMVYERLRWKFSVSKKHHFTAVKLFHHLVCDFRSTISDGYHGVMRFVDCCMKQ